MKREGMVHALRRACPWLAPDGRLIDIHPTSAPARLAIQTGTDLLIAGELQDLTDGCGPAGRHAHADAALATALAQGWLALEGRRDVTFRHEAGTVAEIEGHVAVEWRDARFGTATLERATALLAAHPHGRVVLLEEITLSRLRPHWKRTSGPL
jgi:hypothetical protein